MTAPSNDAFLYLKPLFMLRNYFKIAWRNLGKYKAISFINLFGLTVGLTCCLLILAYILNELNYDKFSRAKNTYRVEITFFNPVEKKMLLELSSIAPPYASLLKTDFPEIKGITQLLPNSKVPIKYGENSFIEQNVFFGDSETLKLFDVNLIKGNGARALNEPFSVMLSEESAKKYFGADDPMNKVIRMNNQFDMKVTGVFQSLPSNTHVHPSVLVSAPTLLDSAVYGRQNFVNNFGNNAFYTYIELPDVYDAKKLEAALPAFVDRHIPANAMGPMRPSDNLRLSLRRVSDIHLNSHKDDEIEENGDIKRVYIFSAIALFILLIACINYMNLSTARSILRGKEIGIRKAAGARRGTLLVQFLCESVLICFIATVVACALSWFLMPALSKISGQALNRNLLLQPTVFLLMLLVPFVVGILSGLYPALFLSSFQPTKVLKGVFKVGGNSLSLRKSLVVVQFAISIILIICTAVVFRQLRYMQNKSLGFSKDHLVTMAYNAGLAAKYNSFRTELLDDPNVKEVTRSSRIPSGRLLDNMGSQINRGDSLTPTQADIKYVIADEDYLPTYQIPLAAGRNFSKAYGADSTAYLINEAAAGILGLKSPQDAIGKQFAYGGRRGQLVGVFHDFHFESLHQRILPMVLLLPTPNSGNYNVITVRLGNNTKAALAHVEQMWKKFLPEIPFDYTFLDEKFQSLYQTETRQQSIFTAFSCIAIFIACLGLFGLSAFTISQRIKEIGIRKVLGADVSSIVGLIAKDFLLLVGIAALVAFPVAWFAMRKWLDDFAYRISIPWWLFLAAAVLAGVIAFVTISFQAVKAATANPVKSLRTE